jgi:hypothetical protein
VPKADVKVEVKEELAKTMGTEVSSKTSKTRKSNYSG